MKQHDLSMVLCEKCAFETNAVFRFLTRDEIDRLNFEKDFRHYRRGDILYHEGNRISGFFCIHSGIIKVFKTGVDGKEQIIRFARRGEIIAYRSVLSNEPACTSAKVIEDSQVCFIPSELLIQFVKTNPSFAFEVVKLTCNELAEANSYITDIAQKTVRERVAEVLVNLVGDFGLDDQKFLRISLTREELANIVGTATESVIRLLSEFKSDRLIELSGRKIKIIDLKGLEKLSS
ncbi:MAG: Crp/Fnr family transcriptional regulator [Bacteroidales bacterium]|nr:Crp/Fnr family transcriptional regulator [Bacteroidales bacterium]MDT8373703.1 Crp/Fnr family transcriptional regulator [Bacteroidales bacterium]